MRTKLTDIISSMDQFNGIGNFIDEYIRGEQVDIDTDMPDVPDKANISKEQESLIKEMLACAGTDTQKEHTPDTREYVLTFAQFINEYNGTITPTASYFGCLEDDEEE